MKFVVWAVGGKKDAAGCSKLAAKPDDIVTFMLAVAQDFVSLDEIAAWLRSHARNPQEHQEGE